MEIKRSYNQKSRRAGQYEIVDEAKAREVFGQTDVAFHQKGECDNELCHYCAEPAMRRLLAGGTIKTFFSDFDLVRA